VNTERFLRSPAVPHRIVGTDVIVAPPDEPDVLLLSGTGSAVWLLLEEPRTVDELVGELAEQFAASPSEIRQAVAGFVEQLSSRGVVDAFV
jgi:hypothetical protein